MKQRTDKLRSATPAPSVSQQQAASPDKAPLPPVQRHVLQLQQALGNKAAGQWIKQMQRKADPAIQRMAMPEEEDLQMKSDPAIQRMEMPEEEELQMKADPAIQRMGLPEEEELQMKADPAIQRMAMPEEEELQLKADTSAPPVQRKGKMPEEVQAKMESAFQTDFSDVNIHEGSQATDVGAIAYAQGSDIHFAQGKFDPNSRSGQELLGHELAHVVQQREGRVTATAQANGLPINDDPSLEREADDLGRKAASLEAPIEAAQHKKR
ncbi:DUF4157 domain-containing protein [Tumebacillus sp. DT12]|uniref:DUF4157 domain-containing protein n=1 Tax=Tumebacillus lacus TaxID=2995335 RepID=A0ABT3X1F7_9BACL|nr:DUF4157 domain-containing protein [Tumebacillus lacus]MCX7570281.1 DUF4157 domain-containing protein [Tumebacillus lacus]